ncbi:MULTISPECIES: hypothetical protein [Aneurinibacillus]|uniref:Uncharacterized protein n=1 Tax=Aneurinibacillus thermoaerophilus TaxID=143495 RepID=A0A1G8D022_ANETH|nr:MULTISPECIES: hypothetical protein [Aneurinibacillus]AMA72276.1 hypothetical protein ACH33_05030 [Aneurinibacillus sp. XH2]MED0674875.1 hypothetical protein [Aneurinibacillus thermoaerophilus]MED0679825.1 hypothetical protein [Aneurinibacillus thermoaerophilus]MED0735857.1 hypothetical protein [Aneurinibacillus thermoaerophilus]MED0758473.1 hypothetical protein [Aneurinibacillus thermoaerophilus]
MVRYEYDKEGLDIQEHKNGNDKEFVIKIKNPAQYLQALRKVRAYFSNDTVHTDVLFYTHRNNEYHVIVRADYYVIFLLSLFKYRILSRLEWE